MSNHSIAYLPEALPKRDFAGGGNDVAPVGMARRSRPTSRAERSGGGWLLSSGAETITEPCISIRNVFTKHPCRTHIFQSHPRRRNEGSARGVPGFTLIELLCVVAIIGVLVSLLMPSIGQVRNKAMSMECASNLRQFGAIVNLYLGDHDNTFPYIELAQTGGSNTQGVIDQNNPPYANQPGIKAQTLQQAFAPYVQQSGTAQNFGPNEAINKLLQCPSDMISGTNSNYAQYGSSYMWSPVVDGDVANSPTLARRGMLRVGQLSKLRLMMDFSAVHQLNPQSLGTINILYADGHVVSQ